MRYSISNAIPHNPKSEKHPYENLVKVAFSHFFDSHSRRFRWPLLPEILLVEFHQLDPRLLEYFQRELVGVALSVYHP